MLLLVVPWTAATAWNATSAIGIPQQQANATFSDCVALFNGSILASSWTGSSSSYKNKMLKN